jgi:hypothetical protein
VLLCTGAREHKPAAEPSAARAGRTAAAGSAPISAQSCTCCQRPVVWNDCYRRPRLWFSVGDYLLTRPRGHRPLFEGRDAATTGSCADDFGRALRGGLCASKGGHAGGGKRTPLHERRCVLSFSSWVRRHFKEIVFVAYSIVLVAAVVALVLVFVTDWIGVRAVLALVVGALVLFFLSAVLTGSAGAPTRRLDEAAEFVLRWILVLAATAALVLVLLAWHWLGARLAVALLLVALVLYVLSISTLTLASIFGGVVAVTLVIALVFVDWPHVGLDIGKQTERPRRAGDLQASYHRSMGSIVIDLRKLVVTKKQTIKARVGLGRIIVIVPARFTLRVGRASVGAGELALFDQRRSRGLRLHGAGIQRAGHIKKKAICRKQPKASGCRPITLTLNVAVGLGGVVVRPARPRSSARAS